MTTRNEIMQKITMMPGSLAGARLHVA